MRTQNNSLIAPYIPVAESDGLIKTMDLTSDIEVRLETWSYSESGDTYQFRATTSEDELIGSVPGYAGIEAGDVIRTRCNDAAGPIHVVQEEEVVDVAQIAFP
jgi:hypothetical protein